MDNLEELKRRWREAKGTRTIPDIAECTGLSPNAVEHALSVRSVKPGFDTVIRISRELNVSLDDVFDIRSAPDELRQQDAAHWKARYESAAQEIFYLRRAVAFLCSLFLILLAWAVMMDLRCADVGFYRGSWTFGTVVSMVFLALAALIVAALLVITVRRRKK